ncbi:hypothetical protein AQ490_00780 [Wenjunlia vitaminophila]|uniref:DUF305 domain-containing protein n=1 Tax=Wenjunlia vitaminophila TaxID=76728 RepID=A0A0T6M0I4_WENVI|nr:hypothetical protein AQ490_00780 [Wenjunlia vitaminophila]
MTTPRRRVWWPAVAGAVLALCLAVGAVLVYSSDEAGAAPGSSSVEAGFCRDMAVHHQQAVEMSFIVRDRTDDEDVRALAYDIANTQANQRGMMLGWLDMWGLRPSSGNAPMAWMAGEHDGAHAGYEPHDGSLMPGMATNTELDRLRAAKGRAAEVLYLQLMIKHHQGGVSMAQGAVDLSDNKQIDRLAGTMVNGQKTEIDLMNGMLRERGSDPVT